MPYSGNQSYYSKNCPRQKMNIPGAIKINIVTFETINEK